MDHLSWSRARAAWALPIGAALALGCSSAPPVAPRSGALVGGEPSDLDAVVVVTDEDLSFACTGAVIGTRLVVTAAHCVSGSSSALRVLVGDEPTIAIDADLAVSRVFVDPAFDEETATHDVALLELASAWTGPFFRYTTEPVGEVGDAIAVYGIGVTSVDGENDIRQRTGTTVLSSVDAGLWRWESPPFACSGDSGGPVALIGAGGERTVAAVISFSDEDCTSSTGAWRLSASADFVERTAAAIAVSATDAGPGAVPADAGAPPVPTPTPPATADSGGCAVAPRDPRPSVSSVLLALALLLAWRARARPLGGRPGGAQPRGAAQSP